LPIYLLYDAMKLLKTRLIILIPLLTLASCGHYSLINAVFFPDTCYKCVVKHFAGHDIWEGEECGGKTDALEIECKAKAYDNPGTTCECIYYDKESGN
jgi:hypothetical protein